MRRAVLLAALLSLLPAPATEAGRTGWCLIVTNRATGTLVATHPLDSDNRFALTYRHSYYDTPATEWLTINADGDLALHHIESPTQAVLDYYELPPSITYHRTQDGWTTGALNTPALPELPILATAVGRRTLVVGNQRVRLWSASGTRAVTIDAHPCRTPPSARTPAA